MSDCKKKRSGRLEKAGAVLPEMLKEMKLGREFKQHMVLYQWEEIVGRDIAAHARPVKLEFKRLFVRTSHPAWAEQLKYMEYDLKQKINSYIGEYIVQELVFTNLLPNAAYNKIDLYKDDPEKNLGLQLKKIELTSEETGSIKAACQIVSDDELRGRLELLGRNINKMTKYRRQHKWQLCAGEGCSALCPPEDKLCSSCQRKQRLAKAAKIHQLLLDMPWSRYGDILRELACTEQEFKEQRLTLIQRLAAGVDYGDTESLNAKMLVMLYRSVPPEQLNDEVMRKTLHRLRYDVHYVPKASKRSAKAGGNLK